LADVALFFGLLNQMIDYELGTMVFEARIQSGLCALSSIHTSFFVGRPVHCKARRPNEFAKKIDQNVAQDIFCQNKYIALFAGKMNLQNLGSFFSFKKAQRIQFAQSDHSDRQGDDLK
jgi:hypothetical protein